MNKNDLSFRPTENDIKKWEDGTREFHSFWSQVDLDEAGKFAKTQGGGIEEYKNNPNKYLHTLKTIFLGEKPCANVGGFQFDNDLLEKYGLKQKGRLVFNPTAIEKIAEQNKDVFAETSADKIMESLSFNEEDPVFQRKQGLLLGFPHVACESFIRRNSANHIINQETDSFGIGDITWIDQSANKTESKMWQIRLETAFRVSGILQ